MFITADATERIANDELVRTSPNYASILKISLQNNVAGWSRMRKNYIDMDKINEHQLDMKCNYTFFEDVQLLTDTSIRKSWSHPKTLTNTKIKQ